MLRITRTKRGVRTVILLEGRLAGCWVEELERASESSAPSSVVDLSGVTFADAPGVAALRRLRANGAELIRASVFIQELLRVSD